MSLSRLCPGLGGGVATRATSSGAPAGGGAAFANEWSIECDGTGDFMEAAVSVDFYALSVWFKPDSTYTQTGPIGCVVGFDAQKGVYLGGDLVGILDPEKEIIDVASLDRTENWAYASTGALTIDTNWHHIAVSWRASSATNSGSAGYDVWLDGVKVGNDYGKYYGSSMTSPYAITQIRAGDTEVDSTSHNPYYPFAGHIDEVAIFDAILSDANIATLYNSGNGAIDLSEESFYGDCTGWWRMGDNNGGTGTTVTDVKSGNDGTLTNTDQFVEVVPS